MTEDREGTISMFNGPVPTVRVFDETDEEGQAIGEWLAGLRDDGFAPHEIGVFVRSDREIQRARAAADLAGIDHRVLDDHTETAIGTLSIITMHLRKDWNSAR
jgi:hypothetical protein